MRKLILPLLLFASCNSMNSTPIENVEKSVIVDVNPPFIKIKYKDTINNLYAFKTYRLDLYDISKLSVGDSIK